MKKYRETLKDFVDSYQGFDFENGTLIIVKYTTGKPIICTGGWKYIWESHLNDELISWTHSADIFVATVDA